jgi:triacylglycerol lipase
MLNDVQASEMSLLVAYAADMHQSDRASLAPAQDPRLTKYKIIGYLTATDSVLRVGRTMAIGDTVYYGYVAQMIDIPGIFVAVIRGTEGMLEWIEDAEFMSVPHPVAGKVEQGFFGIYSSMQYRPIGGDIQPAAKGVATAVGNGSLIVLGHSLGSALATYLTFDLASPTRLGQRVQACLFASPRTGNADFVKAFDARVIAYQLWNYELDVVPRVPRGADYADLPKVCWLGIESIQAKISFSLTCHHHVICYAAMLNYPLLDWRKIPAADQPCAACIKGPR